MKDLTAQRIEEVRDRVGRALALAGRHDSVVLVGACKTKTAEEIRRAVDAGIDALGENRVQEFVEKSAQNAYEGVPVHFIGHLQSNKLRSVVGRVRLIQSADSLRLISLINSRAEELGTVQELLLEVNIGGEESKSGFSPDEIEESAAKMTEFSHISIRGLMAIPPITEKNSVLRAYFAQMYKLFIDIKAKKYDNVTMDYLSMGMSGDFEEAILEGSNMIRVGSAIFGAR